MFRCLFITSYCLKIGMLMDALCKLTLPVFGKCHILLCLQIGKRIGYIPCLPHTLWLCVENCVVDKKFDYARMGFLLRDLDDIFMQSLV